MKYQWKRARRAYPCIFGFCGKQIAAGDRYVSWQEYGELQRCCVACAWEGRSQREPTIAGASR